jgi:hypothetical protein
MTARRVLLALGSLWELVRFFLVLSILALMVRPAGGEGISGLIPWLLLTGTGNLLVPVGGIMLALFPRRYGNLIGLLRLGQGLSVFSIVILFVSGSLAAAANARLLVIGGRAITVSAAVPALFALDLAYLALVVFSREKDAA